MNQLTDFFANASWPLAWWGTIMLIIYTIMNIVRTFQIVGESHTLDRKKLRRSRLQYLHYGLREIFFDEKEEYFRLWDIVIMVFYIPAIVMATVYLALKSGALEFVPLFRRLFGFKLFRIRKPEVKKDGEISPANG